MRRNSNGIRHLRKDKDEKGRKVYYWIPPKFAIRTGLFRSKTLGMDRQVAIDSAVFLNNRIEPYRPDHPRSEMLERVEVGTAAWLAREFEASPKFSRFSGRCQKDYSRLFRRLELFVCNGGIRFGDLPLEQVTRNVGFEVYQAYSERSGIGTANKMATAWQSVFKYGTLKYASISINPFSRIGRTSPPARQQRWTDDQLSLLVKTAGRMGHFSVGLCALLCMELVQRPGDILSLRWSAYNESEGYVRIRQSKRGVEVRVPPTHTLRRALRTARSAAAKRFLDQPNDFICPTKTGKRWHRRNFSRTFREVASEAGLPRELQLRDLRRTTATEGASAGATPWELMAAGGWQNQASIQPYLIWTIEQAASFQKKREAYRKTKSVKSRSRSVRLQN